MKNGYHYQILWQKLGSKCANGSCWQSTQRTIFDFRKDLGLQKVFKVRYLVMIGKVETLLYKSCSKVCYIYKSSIFSKNLEV